MMGILAPKERASTPLSKGRRQELHRYARNVCMIFMVYPSCIAKGSNALPLLLRDIGREI